MLTSLARSVPSNPHVTLVYQGPLDASMLSLDGIWVWDHGYWREAVSDCAHRAPWRFHPHHPRQRYCTGCGLVMKEENHGHP